MLVLLRVAAAAAIVLLPGMPVPACHAQGVQEGPLPQLNRPAPPSQDDDAPRPAVRAQGVQEMTNDTVLRMTKAQVGDGIILQAIRSQPGTYRTGPEDLIALKNAGVSEQVISAMLAKNSGLAQRPDPKPIELAPLSPEQDDPGVYFKNERGQWEPVSPELVKYRDGGALKSVFTNDIVKKDLNGEVTGPQSTLKVHRGTEMMIVAPRQTDAIEYVILRFHEKSDRREFRVKTGNVFHSETGADRDAVNIPIDKVQSRLFSFSVPMDITKGEFGVLAPGSAATPGIAHAGKVYTFSVSE